LGANLLTKKWCNLAPDSVVTIVTDGNRLDLATKIKDQILNQCSIVNLSSDEYVKERLLRLSPSDLVIVLLSLDTFVDKGANKVFSPFAKPKGLQAKYAFVRLDIPEESLFEGLETPKNLVYSKIREMERFNPGDKIHVWSPAGTDITLKIGKTSTCMHEIMRDGDMAFLPPSEIFAEIIPGSANGRIAVDVTVGQLYYMGELMGEFGLVNSPVILDVEEGYVANIEGGSMGRELKEKLFALPRDCRLLVELGHGLSMMSPTGIIGVDESILDTCHFGLGDASACGMHLDVVVMEPLIGEA